MRAAIYRRVSSQEQANSRLGLESQDACCMALANREGFIVEFVFSDDGVSGGIPIYERKDGRRLCDLVTSGGVDVVIALDSSRLFRNIIDTLATLGRWSELGARVVLVDGGLLSIDEPEEFLKAGIAAVVDEYERRKGGKRTKRALAAAKARGTRIGKAPLGYSNAVTFGADGKKIGAGTWAPDPAEQAVIGRVRALADVLKRGGKPNASAIARTLNEEGVPTRNGGRWEHVQVLSVIRRAA